MPRVQQDAATGYTIYVSRLIEKRPHTLVRTVRINTSVYGKWEEIGKIQAHSQYQAQEFFHLHKSEYDTRPGDITLIGRTEDAS